MSVSDDFKAAVFAQETGEVFLVLLAITHDSMEETLRFSSDKVDTVSNGETYLGFPFNFIFPPVSADRAPYAQIEIDNIDRRITEAISELSTPPTVEVFMIRASAPDDIEVQLPDFKLSNVMYDRLVISGTLTVETLGAEPFPAHSFMPSNSPGLFGGVA